jgi:mRNA-degrading endonuclease toxin of MazEF toxin-antitoxin module
MRRGDIYQVDFGSIAGHTAALQHPALLLSNRPAVGKSGTVVVLPITGTLGLAQLFTYFHILQPSRENGLVKPSLVEIELIQAVDVTDVLTKRGQLEEVAFREVIKKVREFLIRS